MHGVHMSNGCICMVFICPMDAYAWCSYVQWMRMHGVHMSNGCICMVFICPMDACMQDRSASVVMVADNKLIGSSFTSPGAEVTDIDAGDEEKPLAHGKGLLPARLQAPGLSPPLDVLVSER
jgi:hypothetical protein